jgi:hypothetical protein
VDRRDSRQSRDDGSRRSRDDRSQRSREVREERTSTRSGKKSSHKYKSRSNSRWEYLRVLFHTAVSGPYNPLCPHKVSKKNIFTCTPVHEFTRFYCFSADQ